MPLPCQTCRADPLSSNRREGPHRSTKSPTVGGGPADSMGSDLDETGPRRGGDDSRGSRGNERERRRRARRPREARGGRGR
eukprot:7523193-Pyramimonas_sp.AAC.1